MKAICLAAALATLPFSAVAKTPDDPVLGQKLAAIADFLYMRPLCETAGYSVDPDSAEKILTPVMAKATAAGITPETADAMAQAATTIRQVEGDRIARDYGDAYMAATASGDMNAPSIALNNWRRFVDGRWGFGFATPTFESVWACEGSDGAFFQSAGASWISQLTVAAASYGSVDFTPPSLDIGFTTDENAAGAGTAGWSAIKTYCDQPPIVSFSGFLTTRPSGSQITTRGGPITPGEG